MKNDKSVSKSGYFFKNKINCKNTVVFLFDSFEKVIKKQTKSNQVPTFQASQVYAILLTI